MLQLIRKFATSRIVAVIFFVPLILSFAVWGIADIFRVTTTDTNMFSIGSTHVPVESFSRDYQNALRNAGVVLPPAEQKAMGQQVLDRMTLSTALDLQAAELGLTASDARVREQIQGIGAFSGPLGTFDHDKFVATIGQIGFGENEFVEMTRKNVARDQMLRSVVGGYQLPGDYARALLSYLYETRAAEYVVLTPAALGTIAPPSETVLGDYVKKHPDQFSTPEYRTVSIAAISVDDVAPTITVSEKDIQTEINDNRAEYITPEKRVLEQIPFKSEADAKAAKTAIDGGKSFDAVAIEHKLAAADYKLGELTEADLAIDPARAKAAFALAAGAVSAPIKGSFGWVLIHAVSITPGTSKSHDEVKLAVQRKLAMAKMADISNAFIDAVADSGNIEQAARKAGMKYIRVPAMDAHGLAPDGSKALANPNPELLAAIFKAEVGEDGDPFATRDNMSYFAIKVDGVTPPKVKPLDAVRAQATARWIAEQGRSQLSAKATALAAKATSDMSMAAVAASIGAPVQTSAALDRRTNEGLFSTALVRALFAATPGSAIAFPTAEGNYIVARVSGVHHPAQLNNDMRIAQIVGQLSQEISGDFTISLAKAVQLSEGMTINQKLFDSTVSGNSGSGS